MRIQFTPLQNIYTVKTQNDFALKYNSMPMSDSVSFGAIKKSRLTNYQRLCANYFKAPLEKFETPEDFRQWAREGLAQTMELSKYEALDELDSKERMKRLGQWKEFLMHDDEMREYPTLAYYVADSITKDLYPETKNFPPLFDKDAFKHAIQEIDKILNKDPKAILSFKKKYQECLREKALKSVEMLEDHSKKTKKSFWVRIPSKVNDPDNYEKNLRNLNILSCESWCTKGHFADQYLEKGDFYIYIDRNLPEISVRLEDRKVKEVRDRNHSSQVGLCYYRALKFLAHEKHLDEFVMGIQDLEYRKSRVDLAKSMLQDDIDAKNFANILRFAGIEVNKLENGLLELSTFNAPSKDYTYKDLGIDENEMFRHIYSIKGNANFQGTQVTKLGALKSVGGYAFLGGSKLTELGDVEFKQRIFWD